MRAVEDGGLRAGLGQAAGTDFIGEAPTLSSSSASAPVAWKSNVTNSR